MRSAVTRTATAGLAAGVGVALVALRRSGTPDPRAHERWLVVTVNLPPQEVAPDGRLPEALRALGDDVEVQVRPAPGDKGTELAARPRPAASGGPRGGHGPLARLRGADPRQPVRAALREAKSVLETGEVLQAQRPGSTQHTLRGLPLEIAQKRSGGEGRL